MTEQEAISVLKMIETHGSLPTNAKDEAIKALEEIQQYRTIGTPEECLEAVENQTENKQYYEGEGELAKDLSRVHSADTKRKC